MAKTRESPIVLFLLFWSIFQQHSDPLQRINASTTIEKEPIGDEQLVIDGQTDGRTDRCTDGRTDGRLWTDR